MATEKIISQPDHGEGIILQNQEAGQGVASPRLQLFFDDITRILGDLSSTTGGTIDPSDFEPSSIIYRPSLGSDILPAIINEKEFIGRPSGGEIEGLSFQQAWAILGNGTANITINDTGGANDFTVESNTSSKMFVVQGSNNRVSIARGGLSGTDGTLHILNASAGVVAAALDGSTLVLEDEFEGGMSILTGSNSTGNLYFGGPAYGEAAGNIWFLHDTDTNLPRLGFTVREKEYLTLIDTAGALFNRDQDTDIDFQINTLGSAPFVLVDAANDRIGFSPTSLSPQFGIVHIQRESSGSVGPNNLGTELVIEGTGSVGISILSNANGSLVFGNSALNNAGAITYSQSTNTMGFSASAANLIKMSVTPGFIWNDNNNGTADVRLVSGGSNFMFFMDSGANRVGIATGGVSPTDGVLHIHDGGSAGVVTALPGGDSLVIESNAEAGLSILTPPTFRARILFGTSNDNAEGAITYFPIGTAENGTMTFGCGGLGVEYMEFNPTQILFNDVSADHNFVYKSVGSTAMFFIDAAISRLGISNVSLQPSDGLVHIQSGTAGSVAAVAAADELIVEGSGATGITIHSPDANTRSLFFASPGEAGAAAFIQCQGFLTTQLLSLGVNNFPYFRLTATEQVANVLGADYDWRVRTVGSTHMIFADAANNRVGISDASILPTDGLLHLIQTAVAGSITASTTANTLVLEGTGTKGLSILVDNSTGVGSIAFGDPTNGNLDALIKYTASSRIMALEAAAVERLSLAALEAVFNDTGADTDLRAEGDANSHKLFLDAGIDELQTAAGIAPTALANIGGSLDINTATNATTAVTTEETLKTYTLPADSLARDGRGVRIRAWGTTGANTDTKQLKLKFGATTVLDTTALAANGETWLIEAEVYRTGAATQDAIGLPFFLAGGMNSGNFTTPTQTLTSAVTIVMTGQNGLATANDIVCEGMSVEYI